MDSDVWRSQIGSTCRNFFKKFIRKKFFIVVILSVIFCLVTLKLLTVNELSLGGDDIVLGRYLLQNNFELKSNLVATFKSKMTTDINRANLKIDSVSSSLSDAQIAASMAEKYPNLPLKFWNKVKGVKMAKNKTCAKFPSYFDVNFNNIYWQILRTSNGSFHLYAAYYDNRTLAMIKPIVRILGMIDRIQPQVKTYCQLWFEDLNYPVFAKTFEYKYIWNKKWGNYKNGLLQPYLIGCQIPKPYQNKVPEAVSLVENPCDKSTINLKVIYNRPKNGKKKNFAVCVKGLDFMYQDLSARLVEWLEMLHILGAEKVYMYSLELHPNITKVLHYYENMGRVDLQQITLPGDQPNILVHMYLKNKVTNKRQNELIPYNDCLYRHMYQYNFIVLLDVDEIIIPKTTDSWMELLNIAIPKSLVLKKTPRASYNVRNVYFMDTMMHNHDWFEDMPKYMHMLQHVYRSINYTKPNHYVKCFHNTERVLTLHNHFPLACLGGVCSSYAIETDDAQLNHYRSGCVNSLKKTCVATYMNHTVMDTAIWKYKDKLVPRVTTALKVLGFFDEIPNST